jgi:DICT domain-containing protein
MCEFLPNYNTKKTKFISSTLLVSYRIDKGLRRGMGRMVHLLIAGYDALNEQFRQDARVPT